MHKRRAAITAVGHYVPDKILSNKDLEKMVDTNDEWIRTRTGIVERRIVEPGVASSDMGARAAEAALRNRGISAEEVELIIVATVTPDMFFPSTACLIQHKIGASRAWGFDLSGACSGFLFALQTATQFIESGTHSRVLVVGTDTMSSITDYTDRNTCVLFGDAAAAVLVEPSTEEGYGILDTIVRCDGSGRDALYMRAGGSLMPATHETVDKRLHYIYQDGKSVFKVAVVSMADVSAEIMERNALSGKDVDWLVPHQANLRIIDATAKRMGLDSSKVMINIDRYGNTTAATIPLCLSEWWQQGRLRRGQRVVLASFGAGYTWGAILVRWSVQDTR
ncbi:MAG: 3-oxoacyl-(acyl-carrier-protein) synthase [Bacteroidetes bacterium]|jgi:3-oxoacyl-[acyl-carrier-protein] synthase-3|nr:3-oxoacyl-(acyl-carrier-protein) synthase [Bacteroidota bacterium]